MEEGWIGYPLAADRECRVRVDNHPSLLAIRMANHVGYEATSCWPITGHTAQIQLQLIYGLGAQFPPDFDPTQLVQHLWGTATLHLVTRPTRK